MAKNRQTPKKRQEDRIPASTIMDGYYNTLHRAHEQLIDIFDRLQREEGLTQDAIARRLAVNKSLVSRRLHGSENLTLRVLSGLATAMDCELELTFIPYKDLLAAKGKGRGQATTFEQGRTQTAWIRTISVERPAQETVATATSVGNNRASELLPQTSASRPRKIRVYPQAA